MVSRRQQFEGCGETVWGADQMQAPAEELLAFGGTVTTVVSPPHLAAATGTHSLANRHWQTVHHKHLIALKHAAQQHQDPRQPFDQLVQPSIEARDIQTRAQVAHLPQHEQCPLLVIPEVHRRHNRHPQHLSIAHLWQNSRSCVQNLSDYRRSGHGSLQ